MYINGMPYNTDLTQFHTLRTFMMFKVYSHMEYIEAIMNIISSKIDCIDISYNPTTFEITINIKKTTMRRAKGYKASSIYYYGLMNSVFSEFFKMYPNFHGDIQASTGIDMNNFDEMQFDCLCNIQCIGDKTVIVRL